MLAGGSAKAAKMPNITKYPTDISNIPLSSIHRSKEEPASCWRPVRSYVLPATFLQEYGAIARDSIMVRRGQAGSGGGTGAVPVGFGFVLVTILYFFSSMTWNTSAPRPPDNPPSVTPVTPAYDTTTASTTPSHQIPAPDRTPSFPVESVSTAPIETEPEVVGIDDKLNSGIPSSRPYQVREDSATN